MESYVWSLPTTPALTAVDVSNLPVTYGYGIAIDIVNIINIDIINIGNITSNFRTLVDA